MEEDIRQLSSRVVYQNPWMTLREDQIQLLEETGIRADHLTHLGFLYTSQGSSSQGFNVFVASGLQHSEPQREREEQDRIHAWFSRPGFRRLVAAGEMADDASLAAYALLMSWEDEKTR
jgi:8-oxo-dGDP phosphatase